MEFLPRVRQIISILLTQEDVIPIKNLAQQIHVSKRTVQRELDYIHYVLKNNGLKLCSKTGAGIWIEGEKVQKQEFLIQLENQNEKDYADKSERRKGLMLELLKDQTPKKLYYYANLLSVSEATIGKDLEHVEPWFLQFNLKIIKKPGYGVSLQGSETNIRIAIREFIAKYMDTPVLKQLYESNDIFIPKVVGIKDIKNRYQLLNEEILKKVGICFASIQDERIKRLTEDSYIGLIIHVTIAIERVLEGEIIETNPELLKKLKQDEDYNLARLIVNSLEKEFDVYIPDIEIAFICLHIKGSKLQRADKWGGKKKVSQEQEKECRELVEQMIIVYDEQLACILAADDEFVTALGAHLRPTLVRLRNHMPIENPHLQEIKENYSQIYERCLKVAAFLEKRLGLELPEAEIGFLAIHFGAALVRLESEKEKRRVVNIGLVCASGIGISRLMASRLQNYLKSKARLITYGKEELTPFVLEQNDFFVSSIDLQETDKDVLSVSPLLPEEDLLRVKEKVQQYAVTGKKRDDNLEFTRQMEKINDLSGRVKEILRNFFCLEVESDITFEQLLEAASTKITFYKENQIRIVQDMKKREEIATQVIPELGIALLHAKTKGTFQMGFYVCVPKSRKNFKNKYLEQVKAAVIMLLPEDERKQENSQILGYLSENLLEDSSFLKHIKLGEKDKIKDDLTRLLKQYFNQYLDMV